MAIAPKVASTSTTAVPAGTTDKPVALKKTVARAKVATVAKLATAKPKTSLVKAKPLVAAKPAKVKKSKLVRDSFTIPKAEYMVLDALKLRTISLAQPAKKSELLRAGIKALAAMSDAALQAALQAVPTIKTGRPAAQVAPKPIAKKAVIVKKQTNKA